MRVYLTFGTKGELSPRGLFYFPVSEHMMINHEIEPMPASQAKQQALTEDANTAVSVEGRLLTVPPPSAEVKQLTKEILSTDEQHRKLKGIRKSGEFQPGVISAAAFGD